MALPRFSQFGKFPVIDRGILVDRLADLVGRDDDRVMRMEKRLHAASSLDQDPDLGFAPRDRIRRVVRERGVTVEISKSAPREFAGRWVMIPNSGRVIASPAQAARTTRVGFVAMATFHDQILK